MTSGTPGDSQDAAFVREPARQSPPADEAATSEAARPERRRPLIPRAPRTRAFLDSVSDFIVRLGKKIEEDNIFFLGGAIAFKVVVAIVPLLLASVGIAGLLLQSRFGPDAAEQIIRLIFRAVPAVGPDTLNALRGFLNDVFQRASDFVGVATLVLIWLATSLVGTLRTVLREIFDLQEDRGIIAGKLFDIQMVVLSGTLLALNVLLTVGFRVFDSLESTILGVEIQRFAVVERIFVQLAAFLSVWFMFVLIYRYLPGRRIQWRIAMIAATFTGLLYELLKAGFGWYVTTYAFYRSTYGNFATVIIFLLWIYYMSVAFVIGGQVGQVAAIVRIRRRQKERLN
ncbi:MAG: YihY/virulence factor BrkB family protein [Longimicrobiales bacterium]